jgi:hypothetical protein
MSIERQMGRIHSEISVERELQLPKPGSGEGEGMLLPHEPVVNEQQGNAALDGCLHHGLARINGGADLHHAAGILELQTVPRAGVIGEPRVAQVLIQIGDNRMKCGHEMKSMIAGKARRG